MNCTEYGARDALRIPDYAGCAECMPILFRPG